MATSMTRWEPFAELGDLRNRIDRLFGDLGGTQERGWMPALDVVRENGNLVLRADVPGIKPKEVTIEVENDVLTVSEQIKAHTSPRPPADRRSLLAEPASRERGWFRVGPDSSEPALSSA